MAEFVNLFLPSCCHPPDIGDMDLILLSTNPKMIGSCEKIIH